MSLTKRKLRLTTSDPIELVSPNDPSVDLRRSDLDAYRRTGDRSHLVTDGAETVFHCRALSKHQLRECQSLALSPPGGDGAFMLAAIRAFHLGCRRVAGWSFGQGVTGDLPPDDWDQEVEDADQVAIGSILMALSRAEDVVPKPSRADSSPRSGSSPESA